MSEKEILTTINMKEDFYQILGVSRDAPLPTIKARYRELSAKYHPDSSGGDADVLAFQGVNEAYKTLSDLQKRKAYDDSIRGDVVSNLHTTAATVTARFFQEQFGR